MACPHTEKAVCYIPKSLREKGINIIPVNPPANTGKKSYPSLSDVVENIDMVDRSEDVPVVVEESIARKA